MKARTAIGLMSGTSVDGIDAALLSQDNEGRLKGGPCCTVPYDSVLKSALRGVLGGTAAACEIASVARRLTEEHAKVVHLILDENDINRRDIDVIGFHGHTIMHKPDVRKTWQIGDGALLASLTGIDVVNDFRSADVAAGGQGAPLAPLYHQSLAAELSRPLAVLNIGGVANVTWIGPGDQISAFDTGPGNALIDDWVHRWGLGDMDRDGALAVSGRIDHSALTVFLEHPYFSASPPKSLDRDEFSVPDSVDWSVADGAATLTSFTAHAVALARDYFPAVSERWLVCGGGRHNPALMQALKEILGVPVWPVESVGWRGDFVEAEAFAYLATRHMEHLPLSLPTTTGVPFPMVGGNLHKSSD